MSFVACHPPSPQGAVGGFASVAIFAFQPGPERKFPGEMGANSQRTYVKVGDLQEAFKYGLWPWQEVQDILGSETCADGKCGYVKRCLTCKVKADTTS